MENNQDIANGNVGGINNEGLRLDVLGYQPVLANEWIRLCAKILDIILLFGFIILTVVAEWLFKYFEDGFGWADTFYSSKDVLIGFGGFWVIVFGIFQIVYLSMKGQTVGKKIFGIKIVKRDDLQNGGFVTNVLLRAIVNALIGFMPFYDLVDILFIFTEEKRCLHDRIAGTIVIKEGQS